MSKDYYSILGVSKNATQDELKKAYRKLSMALHPDRQAGKSETEKKEAEEKFKEVNAAYACLSDPEKKKRYDQFGSEDGPQGFSGFGAGGFDPMDFFRKMHSGFGFGSDGDMFGNFGFGMHSNHHSAPHHEMPEDGQNVQIKTEISFKDSVFGCEKKFDISLTKECSYCNGTGIEAGTEPETCKTCNGKGRVVHVEQQGFMTCQTISDCPDCNGSGIKSKHCKHCHGSRRLADKQSISIKIPAGIDDGQRLRVVGKGHCGVKGGSNGNLYVTVNVQKSKLFERNGINLSTVVPISPIVASLGGKTDIVTPYGKRCISVPKATNSGDTIVLRDSGIKLGNSIGNLTVKFEIEPLTSLSEKQKAILEQLSSTVTHDNLKLTSKYIEDSKEFS